MVRGRGTESEIEIVAGVTTATLTAAAAPCLFLPPSTTTVTAGPGRRTTGAFLLPLLPLPPSTAALTPVATTTRLPRRTIATVGGGTTLEAV